MGRMDAAQICDLHVEENSRRGIGNLPCEDIRGFQVRVHQAGTVEMPQPLAPLPCEFADLLGAIRAPLWRTTAAAPPFKRLRKSGPACSKINDAQAMNPHHGVD